MKVALICYHKNIHKIYPHSWINKFRNSILGQTYKEFDIHELNYGGTHERIFKGSEFVSSFFENFVDAMSWQLDQLFESEYEYVFNSNCDDYFSLDRIEKQLVYLKNGYELVSSNFTLVEKEKEIHTHRFHHLDIKRELQKGHNIICHPSVAYSKDFWRKNRYNSKEIPAEDLRLWQRAINNSSFVILPDNLCFHRIHENSVCKSKNR